MIEEYASGEPAVSIVVKPECGKQFRVSAECGYDSVCLTVEGRKYYVTPQDLLQLAISMYSRHVIGNVEHAMAMVNVERSITFAKWRNDRPR